MSRFDSILFDMDGTLWDAVDSYAAIWNKTIDDLGVEVGHVTRQALVELMGTPLTEIYDRLIGSNAPFDAFMKRLSMNESPIMLHHHGVLYPGVSETLRTLSRDHKLFMVSNCDAAGLPIFFATTGLLPLFTDGTSFGCTGVEKDVNIGRLIKQYSLERPLYVGDTKGDCHYAHLAGVPFAWARYGFGKDVSDADYTIDAITDLLSLCYERT